MTDLNEIFQFQLAKTSCKIAIQQGDHLNAEQAVGAIESIIRWAQKEDNLADVLESAEMMQVTLLVTSITTTTGIVTLLERLQRFKALDLQIAIATAHPTQAQAAGHFGYLLPGVDSVMSLVL